MPEQVLRNAEDASVAEAGDSGGSGAVDDARRAESVDNFVSSVSGDKPVKKQKGKLRGRLKKGGPLIGIVVLLGLFAILIFIAQSAMPFAVVNRLIEEYNTNGISSVLRADNILDVQLSAAPGSTFALSDEQISSLKEQEILPLEFGGGTVLAYRVSFPSNSNEWKIVHGTTPASPNVSVLQSQYASIYSGFSFSGKISLVTIEEAMKDGDFKNPYTTASKTWRGGNSGWYDELASLAEEVHGYTRSRWFKYVAGNTANGITATFKSLAKSAAASGAKDVGNIEKTTTKETTTHWIDDDGIERTTKHTETITTVEADNHSYTSNGLDIAQKFTSMATGAANIACAGVEGFLGVQTVISAYQRLQKINLVSGYMEAVQSVQAGSTKSDPMHEYNNRLTTVDPDTGKTAINAAGMGSMFNNEPVSADDSSVLSVNTEKAISKASESSDKDIMSLFSSIVGDGAGLVRAFKTCNYIKGGLAIANAVITAASVVPVVGQIVGLFHLGFKAIAKAAIAGIISAAAPAVARLIISYMGKKLMNDMATEWLGEDLGNALVSGGNTLLSANHQSGGGSPGSKAKVSAFRLEQDRIIAEEAEYQRSVRSPFDATSQYTFLGSIIYSLVPMANSAGIGSVMKNIGSVMSNSLSGLLPKAAAVAETSMVGLAKEGDCPTLDSMETVKGKVDVQADIYCNPIYITDQSSINKEHTPEEIIQQEIEWEYITQDDNGAITIDPNSNLAKYITYCGQRTSSWGVADANIASAISQETSIGILSAIPIVGDVAEVVTAASNIKNLPWTTGSACVASEANEYWCENQIHQRFIEDQRFFENTGHITNNPVAAYLKDYYEENPLDNSFEGILARYSGMTKDDVIATLELIDGLNYIANYHPEERYAFVEATPATEIYFEETEEVLLAEEPKYIIYDTLRNKTVLV